MSGAGGAPGGGATGCLAGYAVIGYAASGGNVAIPSCFQQGYGEIADEGACYTAISAVNAALNWSGVHTDDMCSASGCPTAGNSNKIFGCSADTLYNTVGGLGYFEWPNAPGYFNAYEQYTLFPEYVACRPRRRRR